MIDFVLGITPALPLDLFFVTMADCRSRVNLLKTLAPCSGGDVAISPHSDFIHLLARHCCKRVL